MAHQVLTCRLDLDDGRSWVFGPEAKDPGDIPNEISWGTQNPGGFGDASITLTRPPWVTAQDAPLLARAQITGPGGELMYQGRVTGTPQIDATNIKIDLEGLIKALSDDESFRFLGVHNDITAWSGPSIQRQGYLADLGVIASSEGGVVFDAEDLSALSTTLTLPFIGPIDSELWLHIDGMTIETLVGSWKRGPHVSGTDPDMHWQAHLADTDAAVTISTSDLAGLGPGTFEVNGDGSQGYAALTFVYDSAVAGFDGIQFILYWVPSAFGTHGLTHRQLPDGRWGLLDSDIIKYAVAQVGAIPVDQTAIDSGATIDQGGFIVPHVVHTGTISALIELITAYGGPSGRLNDWGVYESFFWRPPGWGRTWRARRSRESEPSGPGPTVQNQCTGIVVMYTDGAGRSMSVGPPGSDADFTTSRLADTSPLNIAQRSQDGKIKLLEVGITDQPGAVNIGVAALTEANAETRSESLSMTGSVFDDAGNEAHVADVRACDYVVIEDDGDIAAPIVQPIVSTTYDHGAETLTANIGSPSHAVEAMLAQLTAVTPSNL